MSKKTPPLPEIDRISAVTVQPGDVIIIKSKTRISAATQNVIAKHLGEIFPNTKIIILDADTDLLVATPVPTIKEAVICEHEWDIIPGVSRPWCIKCGYCPKE